MKFKMDKELQRSHLKMLMKDNGWTDARYYHPVSSHRALGSGELQKKVSMNNLGISFLIFQFALFFRENKHCDPSLEPS